MLRNTYDEQVCSVARTLEIVGERWTLLILRNAFLGVRRFDAFQQQLGIARNILSARLDHLVDAEILERRAYSERPVRSEYVLTPRGRALWPVVQSLMAWGDEFAPTPGGPPTLVRHRGCGGSPDGHRMCDRCGAPLELADVQAFAGPGAAPEHPLAGVPA